MRIITEVHFVQCSLTLVRVRIELSTTGVNFILAAGTRVRQIPSRGRSNCGRLPVRGLGTRRETLFSGSCSDHAGWQVSSLLNDYFPFVPHRGVLGSYFGY